MTWQQTVPLGIVLGVAILFVWRSSGKKLDHHNSSCGCGCSHEPKDSDGLKKAAAERQTAQS